ncbi:MAG: hypothetical protein HWN67_17825 [Candidatus Helarchaeota archaeon]|nr:hypothetical protein [Candidatus Helarchaeota archaeon]
MTKCEICGKRIWFWQRESVGIVLPSKYRVYYHSKCYGKSFERGNT